LTTSVDSFSSLTTSVDSPETSDANFSVRLQAQRVNIKTHVKGNFINLITLDFESLSSDIDVTIA